jgi:hypothetical protein
MGIYPSAHPSRVLSRGYGIDSDGQTALARPKASRRRNKRYVRSHGTSPPPHRDMFPYLLS